MRPIRATPRGSSRGTSRRRLAAALLLTAVCGLALGQDEEEKKPSTAEALRSLEEALDHDASLTPETREALRDLAEALRAERDGAPREGDVPAPVSEADAGTVDEEPRPPQPPERSAWEEVLDRLTLYGNLRLRYEGNFNLDDKPDRNRARLRLRLGANFEPVDDLLVGARITTGDPDDPRSPYVTLGDGFDGLDISLDRAFLAYRPAAVEGASLTAGKFGSPFYVNPVYGELVWDADVQPEGGIVGVSLPDVAFLDRLSLWGGVYVLLENATADDVLILPLQASVEVTLLEALRGTLGVGYYLYGDPTPDGTDTVFLDNAGNATVDTNGDGVPDAFVSDFGVLNPIAALTYEGWGVPVTVSGEYMLNTRAAIEGDQGWAVGVSAGGTRSRGDWRLYYQWQVVEQDAVFSPVAQDDFLSTTNFRGHVFGANYQLLDKVGLHVWALVSRPDMTSPGSRDEFEWRVRVDLNVRF